MTDPETLRWVETALTALGSAATAVSFMYRRLDRMITEKVKAQVTEAMRGITEATSRQHEQLRADVKEDLHEFNTAAEARSKGITERIDLLMLRMQK